MGPKRPAPTRSNVVEAIYAAAHWLLSRERPADAAKVFRVLLNLAPRDERGWLGLGECHELVDQLLIASELYGAGSVIAGGPRSVSVRCLLARARVLSKLGRGEDVAWVLEAAENAAVVQGDDELVSLVTAERRRLS
jgi:hypothetical protein